jgi:hypothetical protein
MGRPTFLVIKEKAKAQFSDFTTLDNAWNVHFQTITYLDYGIG